MARKKKYRFNHEISRKYTKKYREKKQKTLLQKNDQQPAAPIVESLLIIKRFIFEFGKFVE